MQMQCTKIVLQRIKIKLSPSSFPQLNTSTRLFLLTLNTNTNINNRCYYSLSNFSSSVSLADSFLPSPLVNFHKLTVNLDTLLSGAGYPTVASPSSPRSMASAKSYADISFFETCAMLAIFVCAPVPTAQEGVLCKT